MVRRFEQKATSDELITVIKLDKSGGCADRDDAFMQQMRQAQIREYFFGDKKRTLSPHTQTVDFNSVTIYKIRQCKLVLPPASINISATDKLLLANSFLSSFLPGGEEELENPIFD